MTIHLLQIPSEPADWAAWLEDYFPSGRLGELVHELKLVQNSAEDATTTNLLSDILNPEQLESVRQSGLAGLPTAQVQQLIANPESLLELQETLLSQGSDYWDPKFKESDLHQTAESIRQRIDSEISAAAVSGVEGGHSTQNMQPTSSRRTLIAVLVTTAAGVLGLMFWPASQDAGSGRVLGQAGLVSNDVDSSSAYLNRLADAGATWFDHRPDNKEELAILLSEVSNDCQLLIDAPHEALSESEREWFVTKCQNWKTKFDETLASLNTDTISFTDAQSAADAIMTKLVAVVRAGPTA